MNDRDELIKLIKSLREENQYLKKLLADNNIKTDLAKGEIRALSRDDKINIYMSYFKGREDVYALKYISNGKKGYSKVCQNKFKVGCDIYNTHCKGCSLFKGASLTREVYFEHLRSNNDIKNNKAIGIYPMVEGNRCYFLAIDFDDEGFKEAAVAYKRECDKLNIDSVIEVSQSGRGAHVWIFFENSVKARDARILGDYILTNTINNNSGIKFNSYDRFFPAQDIISKDGYGSLIALPLEGNSVAINRTSMLVDDSFNPYSNQIDTLSKVKKVSDLKLATILLEANKTHEELESSPKLVKKLNLKPIDFNNSLNILVRNEIFISKDGLSNKALSFIRRLGVIHNPEFYDKQAKRISTYGISRIIALYKEDSSHIGLPRGALDNLIECLESIGLKYKLIDERTCGTDIEVTFNGELRENQKDAVETIIDYDNGVLVAPTGSGKTIMGLNIISLLHKRTLILVEKTNLLDQWCKRIKQFLTINKDGTEIECGYYTSSKHKLSGIIDVAMIRSIENASVFGSYDVILVDEAHHIASRESERIIRMFNARYVYGLTATAKRSDKLEKIIFKSIGPIRYEMSSNYNESIKRELRVVFTKFKAHGEVIKNNSDLTKELALDEERNSLIIENALLEYENSRGILILTKRVDHIKLLYERLGKLCSNVYAIAGEYSKEEKLKFNEGLTNLKRKYIIISTGQYLGEGFDLETLDTLFLAMPIKWEGLVQQFTGRIERLCVGKRRVMVYDFVDIKVGSLCGMFKVRLPKYQKLGYSIINEDKRDELIYSNNNYKKKLFEDIEYSKKMSLLVNLYNQEILDNYLNIDTNITVITNKDIVIPDNAKLIKRDAPADMIIIDSKIIWYGSLNPFIHNKSIETILRIEDSEYAKELESIGS